MNVKNKIREAKEVIKKRIDKNGFTAGDFYMQYWTRDLAYSLNALLELGYSELVRAEFNTILKNQATSGEIPAYIETWKRFLPSHVSGGVVTLKVRGMWAILDFLRFCSKFHRWTCDSGLLFVTSIKKYEEFTKDREFIEENKEKIEKAIRFNKSLIDKRLHLIRGSGWYDAMLNYDNKFTLHGQILLYKMYKALKEKNEARKLKNAINSFFWNEDLGYYIDYLGGNHFDTFANALAIIEGIVPEKRLNTLVEKFNLTSTNFGFKNLFPPYKMIECGEKPNTYQNSTIWPFIHCHVVIAFIKKGFIEEAKKEFLKVTKLKRFNEWYNPFTGRPMGSENQLWSAALYIEAYNLL